MQKFGRSLEPFWIKVQRSKKNTFLGHLIPYDAGLRIFSKKNPAQTMGPIVLYTHAKNWEDT